MTTSIRGRITRTTRWTLEGQSATKLVLALVLAIDVLLGLIHVVVMVAFDAPNVLRVDMDGSYGEAWQYVKYIWVIALLITFGVARRSWPIMAWVPLMLYFLLDDALLLHERAGLQYSSQTWAFGLGPVSAQNLGELALSAVTGAVLAVVILIAYTRADRRVRSIFRVLIALVVVLLAFAIVVDTIHGLVIDIRVLDRSLGLVEDMGEMIALTLMVAFCFRINMHRPESTAISD